VFLSRDFFVSDPTLFARFRFFASQKAIFSSTLHKIQSAFSTLHPKKSLLCTNYSIRFCALSTNNFERSKKILFYVGQRKISIKKRNFYRFFNPGSRADGAHGWDDAAYAAPLPRSDGYAHG
jgi:hypothetical protein